MDLALTTTIDLENTIVHDLDFREGTAYVVDDEAAILQHVKCRLLTFLGEWFLNRLEGVPYFQTVFVKGTSQDLIREIFRQVVAGTPGIETVKKLDLSVDTQTRVASVTFEAITNTGLVIQVGFGELVIQLGG